MCIFAALTRTRPPPYGTYYYYYYCYNTITSVPTLTLALKNMTGRLEMRERSSINRKSTRKLCHRVNVAISYILGSPYPHTMAKSQAHCVAPACRVRRSGAWRPAGPHHACRRRPAGGSAACSSRAATPQKTLYPTSLTPTSPRLIYGVCENSWVNPTSADLLPHSYPSLYYYIQLHVNLLPHAERPILGNV